MEETISILMADLSGYTALTETHGANSAADLIDKYLQMVSSCLVGSSRLHERTGDEVMIVSVCPDHLLATAMNIMAAASGENNFLQVHGGLHTGSVVKRNNSYFGPAVNLTARIAAKASPGTVWCSYEFIDAIADKSLFTVRPKGRHQFKNIASQTEVAELVGQDAQPAHLDPVCKMLILDTTGAIKHPTADAVYFCSQGCLDNYLANNASHNQKYQA